MLCMNPNKSLIIIIKDSNIIRAFSFKKNQYVFSNVDKSQHETVNFKSDESNPKGKKSYNRFMSCECRAYFPALY